MEAALRIFDGIDIEAAIHNLQSISNDKTAKSSSTHSESGPQQGANLVLEAVYLKTKSLQKLNRINGIYSFSSVY